MKTITLRLEDSEYLALKQFASSKRMSMTAVIMQQFDALGVTKPPKPDAPVEALDFVED